MPNWCYNRLTIDTTSEGGKKLAEAFRPKYESEGELIARPFQDLLPCPQELIDTESSLGKDPSPKQKANIKKYGFPDWYMWNIANWGTKWDARFVDFEDHNPNEVYVMFETAWSPPENFFGWFVSQYPDAYFRNEYSEEGMSYEGYIENSQAEGLVQESWDLIPEEEDEK
jgi:hypothetical protein